MSQWKRVGAHDVDGLCPACTATRLLLTSPNLTGGIGSAIPRQGRSIVLNEDFQLALNALILAADSGVKPQDVNYRKVYDRWNLPFPHSGHHGYEMVSADEDAGPSEQNRPGTPSQDRPDDC